MCIRDSGRSLQEEWLGEIMAGTTRSLDGTGAEVVGGHSSMGAELSIGYSITGLLDRDPISLAGAAPGQRLVLTRPLGSGVLFAGEMQGRARGQDAQSLLDTLEVPQGAAAGILSRAGATAMTDVTGFGLAGHLQGMLTQSGVGASIELDAVPIFDGALELSNAGVKSHLYDANRAAVQVTEDRVHRRSRLLFDPQTAGGMLAAVPADRADAAIAELHDAGYISSAIIGTTNDVPVEIRLA